MDDKKGILDSTNSQMDYEIYFFLIAIKSASVSVTIHQYLFLPASDSQKQTWKLPRLWFKFTPA